MDTFLPPQPTVEPPSQPEPLPFLPAVRSTPSRRLTLLLVAAAGLLVGSVGGGAAGAGLAGAFQRQAAVQRGQSTVASTQSGTGSTAASGLSPAAIYQEVAPGVVTISTEIGGTFRSFREATGSGIVVDSQGDILTNAHVVDGARTIHVTFSDGQTVSGTVTGTDTSDDLAVVRVSVAAGRLHPIVLGNSDAVQVGDPVLAIGSPFGLSGSLTSGIVSGLNRSSSAPSGRALAGMIQTDAAINPGNSGGPLLNARGEVIGIDESIQSPVQGSVGVGFAVPINTAKRVLSALEKGQAIQHPWLGISGESLSPALADTLGLTTQTGVLVVEVVSGSPAERAGLQASGSPSASDDVITAIDGHSLTSVEGLTAYLDTRKVGDHVALSVVRGGKPISIEVTLGDFQQSGG